MKINKTNIKKILNNCAFDPNKPGPLKIIADADNTGYYKLRAIELIKEGRYYDAVGLLALTIINEENEMEQNWGIQSQMR